MIRAGRVNIHPYHIHGMRGEMVVRIMNNNNNLKRSPLPNFVDTRRSPDNARLYPT